MGMARLMVTNVFKNLDYYPIGYQPYESTVYSNEVNMTKLRLRALPLKIWYGNSSSIIWELIKNADSQPHPKSTKSESVLFTV